MDTQRRQLLVLILIGGTAVLGSYVVACVYEPEIQPGLWGGLPESLRGFYSVNMLLAAVGFFPLTYVLGFKTPLDPFLEQTSFSFEAMVGAYAAILMPSAPRHSASCWSDAQCVALCWFGPRLFHSFPFGRKRPYSMRSFGPTSSTSSSAPRRT